MKENSTTINQLATLELIKTLRTIKRQLKIMKGISLEKKEISLILEAIREVEAELNAFKI